MDGRLIKFRNAIETLISAILEVLRAKLTAKQNAFSKRNSKLLAVGDTALTLFKTAALACESQAYLRTDGLNDNSPICQLKRGFS